MDSYQLITRADELGTVAEDVSRAGLLSLDLETTGLSPLNSKMRLCSLNTGNAVYVIDVFETGGLGPVADALNRTTAVVIGHNLKFDQRFLLHEFGVEFGKVFDTFRASRMIYNGKQYCGKELAHDLWSVSKRELGKSFESEDLGCSDWSGALTLEQLKYAAEDVVRLPRLREVLRGKLVAEKMSAAVVAEFGAILPEAAMELAGFRLDKDRWLQLARDNDREAARLKTLLFEDLPHPGGQISLLGMEGGFNLDSPQQILESVRALKIQVDDTTEDTLALLAGKHPILRTLLQYRAVSKNLSSFGREYIKHINPVTGRIHCEYWPFTGAGRYSCCAGWTPIRTSLGSKRMDSIQVGDLVWTHMGRWRSVTACWLNGVEPVFEVRLSNGDILTCTGSHRLLTSAGLWVTIQEMIRPQGVTLFAGEGLLGPSVEEVYASGSVPVYDLTVEEDSSYETCGVFSHNCSKPNLQQAPRNKRYRECFRPEAGRKLVICDYSQIELRIMAEVSGDKVLLEIYDKGEDAHRRTASIVAGVAPEKVTKEQRQMAKPVNFGLIYGMKPEGLVRYAQSSYGIHMTLAQAEKFCKRYFEAYVGVKRWQDRAMRDGKREGFTRTPGGRIRYLDREKAHNEYLNSPIQGCGADGLKESLRLLYKKLKNYSGRAKMVHMVHDEILVETDDDKDLVQAVKTDVEEAMLEGMRRFLKQVPVVAEASVGDSWGDKS